MATYNSRLITPPSEEEEIYPYRRVWPSIILESGILFGIAAALFALSLFVQIPASFHRGIGIALALSPAVLWLAISWRQEQTALQPRERLLMVAVVSALAANAVGLPLIENVFQPERWLSLQSAINRIIGYTFTVGLVQAMLTYLILYYLAGSEHLRTRFDTIAYGAASAVGYATVANLDAVLSTNLTPANAAMNVFNTLAIQLALSMLVGYGLSEMRFSLRPFVLLPVATVALGAFVVGAAIPLRAGLTNAGISSEFALSLTSPIRGFLFSTAVLGGVAFITSFLLNTAQQRDLEAAAEEAAA